jgi:hypothetical protein
MVYPRRDAIHRVSLGTTAKIRRDESRLYKQNNMETTEQQKRPTGMTILLVLSFLNACWNILSSLVSYFFIPKLSTMLENGKFEEMMAPFSRMNEEMTKMMTDGATTLSQINPNYYLILLALFVASMVGVIKMFKGDKKGLHIYAIAQICMLIAHSVFVYPLQNPSPFVSDLLLTVIFILLYYMYFKRLEMKGISDNLE